MAQAFKNWRTPTLIILAGCLISLLNFGVRAGFGLWLDPMSRTFEWSREVFALAVAIQNLMWGVAQPFAGALADRYGTARVLAAGAVIYAVGVFLVAFSGTPTTLTLSLGLLVGLGVAGSSFAIVLAAFGRMVPADRRSRALGLGTAAGSMGQFLLVPAGQLFLEAYGWQAALIILSLFPLAIVPLATALAGRAEAAPGERQQSLGAAVREAGVHRGYWLLVAGFFVCGFHVAFIQTHLPSYITDLGLAPELGAWALASVGLFNVVGAYTSGVLGGRYSQKYLLSGLYVSRAVVIALFVLSPASVASVLAFSVAIGLLWLSTVPLTYGVVAKIFGPRYMATLFGFVFFSHQLGAALGVWLGGYLFAATGSYATVWWMTVALALFAALVHLPIDDRQVVRPAEAG
ncbi:MAG: MFS transporter [Alphaproteobacteria bacterium]|nr:MFS transporter [Alphaproteobacteria bacterium]